MSLTSTIAENVYTRFDQRIFSVCTIAAHRAIKDELEKRPGKPVYSSDTLKEFIFQTRDGIKSTSTVHQHQSQSRCSGSVC